MKDFFDNDEEEKDIELTEAQWNLVKNEWNSRKENPPSIQELTQLVFGSRYDGRSREGKAIRKKLAEFNLKATTKSSYQLRNLPELTESQKEYIKNNHKTMKCFEMAEILFNTQNLTNLHKETRTVIAYVRELTGRVPDSKSFEDLDEISTDEYTPPKTVEGVIKKINRYRHEQYDKDKLSGKQKKDIVSLLGYLNTYRFNRQINTYGKITDRDLFESTFIRYTFDKFDLTEEEVDQYILLATEVVISAKIQLRIETLSSLLDKSSEEEDPKISMSLVEAIGTAQTEYNQCVSRQQKLLDSLKVKRSEKEGKNKDGQASILNLIQMMQDENTRVRMLKFAEKKKEKLKQGVEEIMSMDELKCRLIGVSEDEYLNG